MPKEVIRDVTGAFDTVITWSGREGARDVQVATEVRPSWERGEEDGVDNLFALVDSWRRRKPAEDESARGLHCTLDREGLNALIRVLKRAGRQAYGSDEW